MSWIFGCHSQLAPIDSLEFESFHTFPIQVLKTPFLYLAIGGNPKTTFTSKDIQQSSDNSCGWVVTGVGLISDGRSHKIMSADDWGNFLSADTYDYLNTNGHFIAVVWKNDGSLKIFNDLIGLRTVYYLKRSDRFLFSTKLAWLTQVIDKPKLNIHAIGSRWLTFNQLSHQSLITGIEKLAPGGEIEIKNHQVTVTCNNWIPVQTETDEEKLSSFLKKIVSPASEINNKISLGLSGGLDSRTLLSIFLPRGNENRTKNFLIHSFGEKEDPDVKVSNQICSSLDLDNTILSQGCLRNDNILNITKDYARDVLLVEPVSSIIKNIYFSDDYFKNKIVIDGAGGEIARQQFLNRLRLKGKGHVLNKNLTGILKNIYMIRADIFSPDVILEMKKGCLQDIENILEYLPDIHKTGFDNFIDLLAVKFRFPNYYGPEQCRLDKIIISFSPFVQHTALQQIFSIPLRFKKNSRLFHKIIKDNYPDLASFPLVKDGVIYPYGMNTITALIYTKFKKKLMRDSITTSKDKFFDSLRVYVNDLVSSSDVKSFSLYDYNKIKNIVERYYHGDKTFQSQLDWWITFELWRRSVSLS